MSKLIRFLLIGAFIIFVIGAAWAIVAVRRSGNNDSTTDQPTTTPPTDQTANNQTGSGSDTQAPTNQPETQNAAQPLVTKPKGSFTVQRRIVIVEETDSSPAIASARAWIDENGIAHAEASVN